MIVIYRTSHPGPTLSGELVYADRFDLSTHTAHPISSISSESIGMLYDEQREQVISVNVDRKDFEHPKTLQVLNRDLQVVKVLDVPRGEKDDYAAFMFWFEEKIGIITEGKLYWFDPETRRLGNIDRHTERACYLMMESTFFQASPTHFLLAGAAPGPLSYNLLHMNSVCIFDLPAFEIRTHRTPWTGVWDLSVIPERGEIMASSFWRDKIYFISMDDMKPVRTLKIAPCLRPVAYDPKIGRGYTGECFSGDLIAFDVEDGEILDRWNIGKNARKIYVFDDLGTFIVSGCGVFRLNEEMPPSSR